MLTAPLRSLQQLPLERASGVVLDFGLLSLTVFCCASVFFYITSLRGSRLDSLLEGFLHAVDMQHVAASAAASAAVGYRRVVKAWRALFDGGVFLARLVYSFQRRVCGVSGSVPTVCPRFVLWYLPST